MKRKLLILFLAGFLLIGTVAGATSEANDKMVYAMNESSSPSVDLSGENNDGTWNGGLSPDKSGAPSATYWDSESIEFVDDGDYIDAGSDVFGTNQDFTMMAFIKSSDTENLMIMDERDSAYTGPEFRILKNGSIRFILEDTQDDKPAVLTPSDYKDGKWHSVVATWDESETNASIYVDGDLKATKIMSSVDNSEVSDLSCVGCFSGGTDNGKRDIHYFDGFMDNPVFLQRVASGKEIRAYNDTGWIATNSAPSINSTDLDPDPLENGTKADAYMNASDSDGDDLNAWLTVEEDATTIKSDVSMNEPKTNEFELLDIVTIDKQDVFYNFTFTAGDGEANSTKEVSQYIKDNKPVVKAFKPKNKSYGTDDIDYNVTVNDDSDDVPGENVTVRLYDDGIEFRNESVIEGSGTYLTGTISGQSDGNHTFKATATETSGEQNSDFKEYEVDDTAPSINIENPKANSTTLDLDSISLNHVTSDKNLDSSSCKYDIDDGTNFSLNSCGNTTFPVGEYGTHNLTVWAKDTVGNWGSATVEWFADELNVVHAEDKGTGKNLSDFSVTFDNGTATEGGTAQGYSFYVNTSDLPLNDASIEVAKGGYVPANESLNITKDFELNKTYKLEKSGITIETFDEQKQSNQLIFNFTASNSTTSFTNKSVNKTFSENYQNFDNISFPTGAVTITPIDLAGDYKKRNYFVDIDKFSKIDLDTYLLKDGQGIFTGIETVDGEGDKVSNALITIQREFGASYKTVAQDYTASDGTVSMYLDPDIQYRVVATHPNYETFTGTFSPANYQFDNLIIQLGKKSNLTQSTVWDKVEYKLDPQPMTLNKTGKYTFNWSVVDPESGLQEFGLRIKNGSGKVVKKTSVTGSPSGGSVSIKVNMSKQGFDSGEELKAAGYFFKDKNGNTKEFVYERTYQVRSWIAAGIASIKKLLGSADGAGDTAKGIIALFATLFIGGKLKSRFGKKGGGMVSLVVLGIFTLMGWFPGYIFFVTILALVGIYSLR